VSGVDATVTVAVNHYRDNTGKHMNIEMNEYGIHALYEPIGAQVQQIVNDTVQETSSDDLDTAVDTLHERLTAAGLELDRDWARNAVETLRRGDDLRIELG
jgi:hypothetical protein